MIQGEGISKARPIFQISWFRFTVFYTLFTALLNFNLFIYIYTYLDYEKNPLLCFSIMPFYLSLLMAIFSLFFIPYLTKPLAILLTLISATVSYFMYRYRIVIDATMIQNIFLTDLSEAMTFFDPLLVIYLAVFALLPSYLIAKVHIDYSNGIKRRFVVIIVGVLLGGAILLVNKKPMRQFFRQYAQARLVNLPFYPIYSLGVYLRQYANRESFKSVALDAVLAETPQSKGKLLVLMIGESARAANFSLGGYQGNETNAYTKNQPQLVYFSNVIACGTSTAISVPCMLAKEKQGEYSIAHFRENALDVLVRLGVDVIWLGNNGPHGRCQGVCDRLAWDKKRFFESYDQVLLEAMQEELARKESSKNQMIILHLHGSHRRYYERYPEEFKRFTPVCENEHLSQCDRGELINAYDNSLLYTDYLMSKVMKIMERLDKEVALIYVSDHGESLGENGIYVHGAPYNTAPKEQKHVPLMIYTNSPPLFKTLMQKQDHALSHDNIFSSILGFFGIKSQDYDPWLDLFHP